MERKLIIWTDSGDTLVNEGSEYRKEGSDIVESAELIPGAKETLLALKKEGFRIALVADGRTKSFQNVFRQHGLSDIFDAWIISEEVGEEKPSHLMFQTALQAMKLGNEDKKRILMIGNNIKRDILGANRFEITSVLEDWSPRYNMTPQCSEEEPDYRLHSIKELLSLAQELDKNLRMDCQTKE